MAEYKFRRGTVQVQKKDDGVAEESGMICGDYGLIKAGKMYAVVHIPTKKCLHFLHANKAARLYAGRMNDQDWQEGQGTEILQDYHTNALAYATREE